MEVAEKKKLMYSLQQSSKGKASMSALEIADVSPRESRAKLRVNICNLSFDAIADIGSDHSALEKNSLWIACAKKAYSWRLKSCPNVPAAVLCFVVLLTLADSDTVLPACFESLRLKQAWTIVSQLSQLQQMSGFPRGRGTERGT
jgi:hypothetical protein